MLRADTCEVIVNVKNGDGKLEELRASTKATQGKFIRACRFDMSPSKKLEAPGYVLKARASLQDELSRFSSNSSIAQASCGVEQPTGTYLRSCWDFVKGCDEFKATCRKPGGGTHTTHVWRHECPSWQLWNDNGVLRCGDG